MGVESAQGCRWPVMAGSFQKNQETNINLKLDWGLCWLLHWQTGILQGRVKDRRHSFQIKLRFPFSLFGFVSRCLGLAHKAVTFSWLYQTPVSNEDFFFFLCFMQTSDFKTTNSLSLSLTHTQTHGQRSKRYVNQQRTSICRDRSEDDTKRNSQQKQHRRLKLCKR